MAGRLVVVGAINTDLVINAPRLPAPGETVVGEGLQTFGGGKGANAAVAAARAGGDVLLVGAVGDDDAGSAALAALRADGVDTAGVAVLDATPTGAALIVVDARGENQIAIGPGANGALPEAHVRGALARVLAGADTVLVSTEIPLACVAAAVVASAQAGVRCILNPAPVIAGLAALLEHGPLLTPNEGELRDLAHAAGATDDGDGDHAIACRLATLGSVTGASVIVTLGGRGCAVRLADGTLRRIPAPIAAEVVDTTGAGDTFNGVLATRLAAGDDIIAALAAANAAAALSVGASGAREGMPAAAKIAAALERAPALQAFG